MGAWVGPAIVAALISGLVSLLWLYLRGWIAIRHDRRRRREKVRDFQVALRAEIRSELHNLATIDFDKHVAEIGERYSSQPGYSVLPIFPAKHIVFEALKGEIQILPEPVIDEVIVYWRQRHAIEKMVEICATTNFQSWTLHVSSKCTRTISRCRNTLPKRRVCQPKRWTGRLAVTAISIAWLRAGLTRDRLDRSRGLRFAAEHDRLEKHENLVSQ